ncbi:hypothetical protein BDF14DRAFT_444565 [Spinellus fusiger]|nr:hypothetical protein BDF14DRAFT_444565 [Spinellus fusiger]
MRRVDTLNRFLTLIQRIISALYCLSIYPSIYCVCLSFNQLYIYTLSHPSDYWDCHLCISICACSTNISNRSSVVKLDIYEPNL